MTWSDYLLLIKQWGKQPPTHILLAGFLGVLPDENAPTWENEDTESLFARWGGTTGAVVEKPPNLLE